MTSILLSPFVYFLFFGSLSIIILVTACLLGVIDFRWKPSPPPPLETHIDFRQDIAAIRTFLSQSLRIEGQVRYEAGTFQVATPPDCTLAREVVLSELTNHFPRSVFGMGALEEVSSKA